jgi:hypothetical protein
MADSSSKKTSKKHCLFKESLIYSRFRVTQGCAAKIDVQAIDFADADKS